MVVKRNRVKHVLTFEQRLANEAARLKETARALPDGTHAKQSILKRARQTDAAAEINRWLSSPGLGPLKEIVERFSEKN